ncbi:MAG: fructose-6-phosphate aldolase [Methanomassiliicoccales archaeon]|nr:MAG: fructose-6-phosphate aldolase [Methanomassiliicoccales archaeon]
MKIFLDTANVEHIREAAGWGVVDGVTTNPTLIAKEGRKFEDVVQEICSIVDGPISAEVVSMEAEGMVKEAREIAKIHENINIKIPIIAEGLKATKILSKEGIKTNVTLVFSSNQALLACKAGAAFVSPFVGRIDDQGGDGMIVAAEIVQMLENYDFDTELIVASVRHPVHVVESFMLGADIATVPYPVLQKMVKHTLTDVGLKKFLEDWEKVPK